MQEEIDWGTVPSRLCNEMRGKERSPTVKAGGGGWKRREEKYFPQSNINIKKCQHLILSLWINTILQYIMYSVYKPKKLSFFKTCAV